MEKSARNKQRNPKTIGYLRVSNLNHELEKNRFDILSLSESYDLGKVTFVEEIVSVKVSWQEGKLAEILDDLMTGDSIIVPELYRLGRSMLECMEILSVLLQKGIHVYAVKGNWKLDDSIQSEIITMAFSMAAGIERDLISSRTTEALRHRKEQGMKLGRPTGPGKSKLDQFRPEIEVLLANGSSQRFIASRYKTTEANLTNWLKKNSLKRVKISKL